MTEGMGIFAGGIFFEAKEYPSRTHPKKAVGNFEGRNENTMCPS